MRALPCTRTRQGHDSLERQPAAGRRTHQSNRMRGRAQATSTEHRDGRGRPRRRRAAGRRCGSCHMRKPSRKLAAGRDSHEKVFYSRWRRQAATGCAHPPCVMRDATGASSDIARSNCTSLFQGACVCGGSLAMVIGVGFRSETHSVNAHRYNACVIHSPKLHTLCSSPALPAR